MSQAIGERLYQLLPAIYRLRDTEQGEPLRALLAVIERELQAIEANIDGLYDDWFIETCDEWVVPYIGDLLGVRPLHTASLAYSLRAYVANTLAYRRRKGTATVIEQLARDVTGWPTRAVEFFQLLATTQNLNHVRQENVGSPDLRDVNQLDLINGPFDTVPHTAEVRRISTDGGRYNIPNLGVFLWRLKAYPMERVTTRPVNQDDLAQIRYRFNPLGYDMPLINRPQTEEKITHLAEEINVPGPLRRRPLYEELDGRRDSLKNGETPSEVYFSSEEGGSVLEVFDDKERIIPEEILICNLDSWDEEGWLPPISEEVTKPDGSLLYETKVAVDPVLGRLAVLREASINKPVVNYAYGFNGDVGGGPYDRRESVEKALHGPATWHIAVSQEVAPVDGQVEPFLWKALQIWEQQPEGTIGIITVLDSRTYEKETAIRMPAGSQLLIAAAQNRRPHLKVESGVLIEKLPNDQNGSSRLVLDGLLIEGSVTVGKSYEGNVRFANCTLVPQKSGLVVEERDSKLRIELERSICGPISIPAEIEADLTISDSVVTFADEHAESETAIEAPDTTAYIKSSTVLGGTHLRELYASNSIFTAPLHVIRRQKGCVRFSYVSLESTMPRRYRCQPEYALSRLAKERNVSSIEDLSKEEKDLVISLIKPAFTSTIYGHPGYAQLNINCADEIRTGAEDGSEMGVFSHLKQPQREANLRTALEEYLPFGLEAGFFYVT